MILEDGHQLHGRIPITVIGERGARDSRFVNLNGGIHPGSQRCPQVRAKVNDVRLWHDMLG